MKILKVSSKSNPNKVAGAIANLFKENEEVVIHAVGAASVNQSVKAIAVARGYLASVGKEMICIPSFVDVRIEEIPKTGIKFALVLI